MKGTVMENKTKVMFAHLAIVFTLGGLLKAVERVAVNKVHEQWPVESDKE